MMKNKPIISKKRFNILSPDKYKLETDVYYKKYYKSWGCVAFIRKNGSRRLNKKDTELIINILEKDTEVKWEVDSVSNFVYFSELESVNTKQIEIF